MKQFGTIFKFELKNYFKSKVFAGVTIFLVVLIAVLMFFPRITSAFGSGGGSEAVSDRPVMYVTADTEEHAQAVRQAFARGLSDYDVQTTVEGLDWVQEPNHFRSGGMRLCAGFPDLLYLLCEQSVHVRQQHHDRG